MPPEKDTVLRTVTVAAVLCIVCSVLVSTAAVALRPQQQRNREIDRMENILSVVGLLEEGADVKKLYEKYIEPRVVNLETGNYESSINPAEFDPLEAAKKLDESIVIPQELDLGNIKRRARFAVVYLVRSPESGIEHVILPVYGKGLWGTMYGFLALDADLNTIRGLRFYEHVETPGLGGEVDNPKWRAEWKGKQAFGPEGHIKIRVIRGVVEPDRYESAFQVDGLSGATITSRSVTNLIHYWLGDNGYGPYLKRLKEGGGLHG